MDDSDDEATRRSPAEELILRTVAAHADSLLRTARRHSICVDDAQDAYQHAMEIFMRQAHRLDPARAAGWLHVVVKREAQALRSARQELLTSTAIDLDGREATAQRTPEERLLSFDMVSRSAEALKRLKPHELRALWLRAQGHSYSEIGAITGWSYTKINRCLAEGRRNFLDRYERIESGEECRHWLPVISAMVDGEASAEQIVELRPHLRNCPACRATLKALQDSSTPLAALFPVPLLVVGSGAGDHVSSFLVRLYESIAGGLPERAVHHATKAQAILEASSAGKVAAVAASAAAVAGGGYASVEHVIERPAAVRHVAQTHVHHRKPPVSRAASHTPPPAPPAGPAIIAATQVSGPQTASQPSQPPPAAEPPPRAREFRATADQGSTNTTTTSSTAYVTRSASYRATGTAAGGNRAQGFTPKGQEADFAP